jgi:hypothetical protein
MAAEQPWSAVPPELAGLLRPVVPRLVDEIIAAVRAEVPEYDQPLEGEFGRLISQGVVVALEQFVDLLGRDVGLRDLSVSEGLGRAEHRAGRTLDALQSAYRIGARVAWRAVADIGRTEGVEPATMYVLAEAIFAYIDRLAGASVAGFTEAEALRAGTAQARRHALLELLAAPGEPDPAQVERLAAQAGWTTQAPVGALAVGHADPVALARRMPAPAIGAALQTAGLLLVGDPDGPGRPELIRAALRGRRAVLGPTVPGSGVRASVERALAGWPLHAAGELGDAPLARTDDHLVKLMLTRDPGIATDLVVRRLGPLEALRPTARERALTTVRAWLDSHGDVTLTAAALHVHPQTVRHRLGGLREVLGDAVLDDPARRLELALALRAQAAVRSGDPGRSSVTSPPSAGADGPPPGRA